MSKSSEIILSLKAPPPPPPPPRAVNVAIGLRQSRSRSGVVYLTFDGREVAEISAGGIKHFFQNSCKSIASDSAGYVRLRRKNGEKVYFDEDDDGDGE